MEYSARNRVGKSGEYAGIINPGVSMFRNCRSSDGPNQVSLSDEISVLDAFKKYRSLCPVSRHFADLESF